MPSAVLAFFGRWIARRVPCLASSFAGMARACGWGGACAFPGVSTWLDTNGGDSVSGELVEPRLSPIGVLRQAQDERQLAGPVSRPRPVLSACPGTQPKGSTRTGGVVPCPPFVFPAEERGPSLLAWQEG